MCDCVYTAKSHQKFYMSFRLKKLSRKTFTAHIVYRLAASRFMITNKT